MNTWRTSNKRFIWVGISYDPFEESFVLDEDGSKLTDKVKSKWAPGHPESDREGHDHEQDNGGHCVVLADDEEMWDIPCDHDLASFPFVCQKRLKPLPPGTYVENST